MKRLLSRLLILITTLCLFCTLAIVVGHADTRPDELQQLGFDICDDQPCFMGIVPGVTDWQAARAELSATQRIQDQASGVFTVNEHIFIYKSPGETLSVEVIGLDSPIPIGRLLLKYGVPCGVTVADQPKPGIVILRYPQTLINLNWYGSKITQPFRQLAAETPISYLDLDSPALHGCTYTNLAVTDTKWHGLASLNYYRTHPR